MILIAKNLIPKEYEQKYAITNLFRVEIIAFILDRINYLSYDNKFSYTKK
jgi:hypothetical protein